MNISSLIHGKKRYVAAAVAAATLGGGAFAFANSLTVTSNTLGSGSPAGGVASPNTACNPTFSYTTSWSGGEINAFVVSSVTATSSDANDTVGCSADSVQAELTGTGGAPLPVNLAATNYTAGTSGASDFVTWSSLASQNILASAVTGISGVVTGTK